MHRHVLQQIEKYKLLIQKFEKKKEIIGKDLVWFECQNYIELKSQQEKNSVETGKIARNLDEKLASKYKFETQIEIISKKMGRFPRIKKILGNTTIEFLSSQLHLIKGNLLYIENEIKLAETQLLKENEKKKLLNDDMSRYNKLENEDIHKAYGEVCLNLIHAQKELSIWEEDYHTNKTYYNTLEKLFRSNKGEYQRLLNQKIEKNAFKFPEKINSTFDNQILTGQEVTPDLPIKKIVIDGSNLCYEQGQFIGAQALAWLTQNLKNNYEVIVVFDSGAYLGLGFSQTEPAVLEEKIFGKGVKIHKVQRERKADETILKYAENEKTCYVISNDRFRDYPQAEVVKNKRIIQHEILGGKIIIHQLDLALSYL